MQGLVRCHYQAEFGLVELGFATVPTESLGCTALPCVPNGV